MTPVGGSPTTMEIDVNAESVPSETVSVAWYRPIDV